MGARADDIKTAFEKRACKLKAQETASDASGTAGSDKLKDRRGQFKSHGPKPDTAGQVAAWAREAREQKISAG